MNTMLGAIILHGLVTALLFRSGMRGRWIIYLFTVELYLAWTGAWLEEVLRQPHGVAGFAFPILIASELFCIPIFVWWPFMLVAKDQAEVQAKRKDSFKR